jgi:hypothetical protein
MLPLVFGATAADALATTDAAKIEAHDTDALCQQCGGRYFEHGVVHAAAVQGMGVAEHGQSLNLLLRRSDL